MKIALAGNPNSGKTTLFNALTGKNDYVGNWAGVTVSKGEGKLKNLFDSDSEITIIDLPGAYSMSPFTNEESVTKDYILSENIDVIINVVDATNLSRNLFFTSEILELSIPTLICINKIDVANKKGDTIDIEKLSEYFGVEVVKISAMKEEGLKNLIEKAIDVSKKINVIKFEIEGLKEENSKENAIFNNRKRFEYTNKIVRNCEKRHSFSYEVTLSDKIDKVIANNFIGIPLFAFVMWLVFYISQSSVGPFFATKVTYLLTLFYNFVDTFLTSIGTNLILKSLVLDGIIAGVSSIIGYLPLIMILFFCLSLLEDCGYMSRVAIVMDKYFKRIGLSGKSIIPIIVGAGCAVPGIMATRVIKDERERRMTAILTPFIPCSAKVVIIALFAGVFFPGNSWISPLVYFIAIGIIIATGFFVKFITGAKPKTNFIIELPEYKFPNLKIAIFSMLDKAKSFIIKASTIILLSNVIIWFMQTYTWNLKLAADISPNASILAHVAKPAAFLLIPLGFGLWQFAAASISGFAAKETVVSTLAVCFATSKIANVNSLHIAGNSNILITAGGLTAVSALAFLIFNLFTPPCFAAMAALSIELGSKKWFLWAISFQLGIGYLMALFINQIGTFLITGHVAQGFVAFLIICFLVLAGIFYLLINKNNFREKNK